MSDLFDEKHIQPMLIAENVAPFEDNGYLYEMKWDGERCIAYLDPNHNTDLRNKRNVKMIPKVPELSKLHHQASVKCILDGELLCLVNGIPKFEAIQRRSLMGNKYKIELESKRFPATFIAFDCLYYDNEDVMEKPLIQRKEYLSRAIKESERIAISRSYEAEQGMALFEVARQQGLEGVVAKRKDSLYFQGMRTKAWKKIKNLLDDDFVICGYIPKENHLTSLVLGQYEDGKLRYQGHVTLGVRGTAFETIRKQDRSPFSPFDESIPAGNESAIWIKPSLVGVVSFMYRTPKGSMRQPVFKGLRDDKSTKECVKTI